jgi:D-cysteine desulfhydrase/L-cysteate sulfo-lyase
LLISSPIRTSSVKGYGIPTRAGLEAIALFARTEALLLDPCYTSKAAAAMITHIRDGEIGADQTVVFLHTGGTPALFTDSFVEVFAGR